MIPLRVHNILDYCVGAVLVLVPYIFGMADIPAARGLFLTCGFGLIAYSLLTKYRYSAFKLIPVGFHMALDVILGFCLMLGPALMGYRGLITGVQNTVHVLLGLGAVALVVFTDRRKTQAISVEEKPGPAKRAA